MAGSFDITHAPCSYGEYFLWVFHAAQTLVFKNSFSDEEIYSQKI
jgi:hypothetical protein